MSLLKVTDLVVSYGGIEALKGISFEVDQGKIVTLIGANGAGKSTTVRTISGLVTPKSGRIYYEGRDITDFNTQKIVETGIAMVPEGRRVFANLTVLENLRIGAYLRKDKEEIEEDINYVYDLFPRLKERSWQLAGTLSGGEQQMLAVGRAIMTRPKIIMMDEPSLGLAPLVVKDIFMIIQTLKSTGMTVLLIEQNANAALHACDYAYVMETGRITMSGTGEELLASEAIQEAYLGKTSKNKMQSAARPGCRFSQERFNEQTGRPDPNGTDPAETDAEAGGEEMRRQRELFTGGGSRHANHCRRPGPADSEEHGSEAADRSGVHAG